MYVKYTKNNIRWLVKGTLSDSLKGLLDSIDEDKNYEIIRNGNNRRVLKYTHGHESFYIKQYSVKYGLQGIKTLFSLSKAHREWDRSLLLIANHLLTAEPVAIGEKRRFGILKSCYIISKEIPRSTTVRNVLIKNQSSSENYKLLKGNTLLNNLISYIKRIHDLGVFHGELHADNILVNQDDLTSFYLIDLGRTKLKEKLSLSLRIQDMARLLYSLMPVCTGEEIMGLINKYVNHMGHLKEKKLFTEKVFNKLYKIKRRIWYSRAHKSLKSNDVFKVTKYNKYAINMRNEWNLNVLLALISKHDVSLKKRIGNIIKISSKTNINCIPTSGEGEVERVYIKEYKYLSFSKQLLYSFHNSPARKAWFAAHGLMALGFRTPQPIALLEERDFYRIKRSLIISEDLSPCLVSNKYMSEKFRDLFDKGISQKKRMFISCLAASFQQLHNSNIYHGDLKAENILVMELQNGWDFYYLDLDRVFFNKKITLRRKIKNLSQLNASMPNCITYTDRLRFYRAYAGVESFTKEHKQILQIIIHGSRQRNDSWNPSYKIHRSRPFSMKG